MFERLGSLTFKFRFAILVAWTAAAIVALAFAPSLAKVGSTDQSSFLPPETESIRARVALERAFPREVSAGSATIAFSRESGLTRRRPRVHRRRRRPGSPVRMRGQTSVTSCRASRHRSRIPSSRR